MILLLAFAFLAGIVTILSPCILPILPVILSSTIAGGGISKSRPLGVVAGFLISFTLFTLFLSTIVRLSGIPSDSLRLFSVFVIALFGISLLIAQVQVLVERLFSKLAGLVPSGNSSSGFFGGFIIGLTLGLLWTPCVGPILASVISLAISGNVNLEAFLITASYSAGTAIPMFLIMLGGQSVLKRVPWLLQNSANIQKVFGLVMVITALGIYFNLDRKFQTFILDKFPGYGAGLTNFEDIEAVRTQLKRLTGDGKNTQDGRGKPMYEFSNPKRSNAPEITAGGAWINSEPLNLGELKGKVVLVDFWTYSCINCQRTFPYLRSWWEKYEDKGLVIIGVHSPEFEFEKDKDNVIKAVRDFDLKYPIVQDNDFITWRAYNNRYWPAKYLIDKEGKIRYTHFGEGAYDETEMTIQQLLREAGSLDTDLALNNPDYKIYSKTPETYLGYKRIANFASAEKILPDRIANYSVRGPLPKNSVAFLGDWEVTDEFANPKKGAKLYLNFESKEVFLVMRTKGESSTIKVSIDGEFDYFGEDNMQGMVKVDSDRLYKLISLPEPGRHELMLEFEDENIEVFAFTFG